MKSSLFNKNLIFSRIKKFYYEADFKKEFTLNTLKAITTTNVPYSKKLERKYPNYSIVMLGSEKQLDFFDRAGRQRFR